MGGRDPQHIGVPTGTRGDHLEVGHPVQECGDPLPHQAVVLDEGNGDYLSIVHA